MSLNTSAEFNHLFDTHFYVKGTHLYQFSLVSTYSTTGAYNSRLKNKKNSWSYVKPHNRCKLLYEPYMAEEVGAAPTSPVLETGAFAAMLLLNVCELHSQRQLFRFCQFAGLYRKCLMSGASQAFPNPQYTLNWVMRPSQTGGRRGIRTPGSVQRRHTSFQD